MAEFNAYLLEDGFDAAQLPEGKWVTISGTPAFDDAYTAIRNGAVQEVGVKYDDEGTTMLVFSTESNRRQNKRRNRGLRYNSGLLSGELQQVKVRDEDLIKEVRAYSAWKMAWWREAIQNSVDAGARTITLTAQEIEGDSEGNRLVSCQDDGSGMSPDILENKFLARFGTTKDRHGTTGGFGEAKKLLLFAWKHWRIITQDVIVEGKGEVFRGRTSEAYLHGTRIESIQPAAEHTTLAHALAFAQRCHLPNTRITYVDENGVMQTLAPHSKADISGLSPIKQTDEARIYFIKNKRGETYRSNFVWVRVYNAGLGTSLFMFDKPLADETEGQVIVEIVAKSTAVLTANRDGFQYFTATREMVESFIQELAKDSRSALKPRNPGFTKTYNMGQRERVTLPDLDLPRGDFKQGEGAGQARLTEEGVEEVMTQFTELMGSESGEEAPLTSMQQTAALARGYLESLNFTSDLELKRSIQQLKWKPDFIVINELEGFDDQSVLRTPLKKFYPEEMTPTIARLARVWMELCRWALMQLRCDQEWGIGFLFGPETGAMFSRRAGLNWLLLNPFKMDWKAKQLMEEVSEGRAPKSRLDELEILSVTDRQDFKWLYALAVHEVTHFAGGLDYHDEAFSSALTDNIAKCADGMSFYNKILDATASRRAPRIPKPTKAQIQNSFVRGRVTRKLMDEGPIVFSDMLIFEPHTLMEFYRTVTLDRPIVFENCIFDATTEKHFRAQLDLYKIDFTRTTFKQCVFINTVFNKCKISLDNDFSAKFYSVRDEFYSPPPYYFEECNFHPWWDESQSDINELDLEGFRDAMQQAPLPKGAKNRYSPSGVWTQPVVDAVSASVMASDMWRYVQGNT